mmetsp:Transcript_26568/g.47272  ORF Transcript_26568/g.47272 Transcript_26568/m.47272 type:complete len:218 (-) Transcript_26568:81-734(-)|eukprot:CAMPEP_0177766332 /NCGR_PEP_ID=MMETSP0491_2-20121128/8470_1 /TAXON_ID=63592 /ORGANISM="Tetraselmis chuii, Strain PLY429" /LENGTH=217 /DNA_ID=CAMNT_0019282743 /DNA_START=118 /DNA_END=771 /DNA_ORIENTATION=+
MASLSASLSCVAARPAAPTRSPSASVRGRRIAAVPVTWRQHRVGRASRLTCSAESESTELPIEKSMPSMEGVMNIDAIMKILPHRFPFLLLDRVLEVETQKYAVGYKNITMNDNFFPGHFPERPLMPGVLQVEAMAQLGGICMLDPNDTAGKNNFFFGGIDSCKFRRPVIPGDCLMMRVELTKFNKRFGMAKMSAKGYVGQALAVEAELTLVLAKGE